MSLIKSKERVDNLGEVFTPENIVSHMLQKIPKEYWETDKTFLEPTCGTGNFLVEILKKKVKHGNTVLDSLKTIYGIDIMEDNVIESRKRLFKVANDLGLEQDTWNEAIKIIKQNIICGNISELDLETCFNE